MNKKVALIPITLNCLSEVFSGNVNNLETNAPKDLEVIDIIKDVYKQDVWYLKCKSNSFKIVRYGEAVPKMSFWYKKVKWDMIS